MNHSDDREEALDELLRKLVDGGLSKEQSIQLAELLNESESAQTKYLKYIQVHADLTDRWGSTAEVITGSGSDAAFASVPAAPATPQPDPARPRGYGSWVSPITTFVCGVAVAMLWQAWTASSTTERLAEVGDKTRDDSVRVAVDGIASNDLATAPTENDSEQTSYTDKLPAPQPMSDVAVIVRTEGVADERLVPGARLKPGLLNLRSGTVQLEFLGGAMVAVRAPARLQVETRDGGTLLQGRAIAHVPQRARGFVLNAPSVSVLDLDTDFSLHVNEKGEAEVGVLRGEVELSLLGEDGTSFVSRTVSQSERIRVDEELGLFKEVVGGSDELMPSLAMRDTVPLVVGQAYVDQVRDDGAVLYWRFEPSADGRIANEVSQRYAGKIVTKGPPDAPGIELVGHARFELSEYGRYILTDEAFADLNLSEYTVEFWVNPDSLSHASCVGIVPEPNTEAFDHLNVIEVVNDSFPLYAPGAIRFLHRNPPSRWFNQGLNLISPSYCTPRAWQHVVAVKEMDGISLYLNGELAKTAPLEGHHCEGDFNLFIGQLRPKNKPWRQFAGGIDELAVYRRGLSGNEVKRHYDLIMGTY
ncbi:MAG: LamG-like jellyroll fold domain-containing protein [Planctomycetota bacterium]